MDEERARPPTFCEYQELAKTTARRGGFVHERLTNWALGAAGETGELCELIKKTVYHRHAFTNERFEGEIGDALWYLAMICNELGLDLGEVARKNVAKLLARYPNGFSEEASQNRRKDDV